MCGRVVEGAGEDPFLGSAIAAAKVRATGLRFQCPGQMAATVKHFAAYGAPVAVVNTTRSTCPPSSCSTTTCSPYKAAIHAGAATVMASFNSLDGVPNTANPYTLQTILRQEWGFGGTVLSDYQAVQELEAFGLRGERRAGGATRAHGRVDIEMAVQVGNSSRTPPMPTTVRRCWRRARSR